VEVRLPLIIRSPDMLNHAPALTDMVVNEIMLFAAAGFLIGAIDEALIDIIWLVRQVWRKVFVFRRFTPAHIETLEVPEVPGRLAVFVPAWDEAAVVGDMLAHTTKCFQGANVVIFVGCYPNDPATIDAVKTVSHASIRTVIGDHPGPTTKADCLNTLWHALIDEETRTGEQFKAIILHDAEDAVSADEIPLIDRLIEKSALVQLPVVPLIDPQSRWVGGHYCDEFAEAHGKTLVVREFLGAGVPAAGVGCAIRRDVLCRLAATQGGDPFDVGSLTEDYELGLRIHALGERTIFVRLPHDGAFGVVATRALFPATLETAVRQKTRWMVGIALAGWDRLGWRGGFAERWMRLRDRRSIMAAILLTSAYGVVITAALSVIIVALGGSRIFTVSDLNQTLVVWNLAFLLWRMAVRGYFVARVYGWREGLRSIPRTVLANIIAIMAARRAVAQYWGVANGQKLLWDKTAHKFPAMRDRV
jgi:bacteriophage N4 adsorption protein B